MAIGNTKNIENLTDVLITVKTGFGFRGIESYRNGSPLISGSSSQGRRYKTVKNALKTVAKLVEIHNYQVQIEGYREEGTEGKLSLVTYYYDVYRADWYFVSSFPTNIKVG